MSTAPITATEPESRGRAVSDAAHSSTMEGLTASPEFHADAAEYVEGTIDLDEFGRRTRARNGVSINVPEARP